MSDDERFKVGGPEGASVPLTWTSGGKQIAPTQQLVHTPSEGEVNTFSSQRRKTCGDCKFMEVNDRTARLIKQSDVRRTLKLANKWEARYLPIVKSFNELGICAQRRSMVGPTSGACEFYKAKR